MDHHGILSLAPAIVAIVLAVASRNVILSLFGALVVAGMVALGGNPLTGTLHAIEHQHEGATSGIVGAIADGDHAKTMLFTILIGAMVGVIGKSGGTRSLVEALAKRASSPRSVRILSWIAGMLVFFDDYANCMIVGSAMGPLYDRHGISRAKLAYIVDSTAAPVASLALVSTWVGYEVGVIDDGLTLANVDAEPYAFFVSGWAYRFYPIIAILFVGMVAWSGRDIGPMQRARFAESTAEESDDGGDEGSAAWWVAALPVTALVVVTLAVLYLSGRAAAEPGAALFQILENADGYGAILQGSLVAALLATTLALVTRSLTLEETTKAAIAGMKIMFEALIVLVLAWSLSTAMKELGAPTYLVGVLQSRLPPALLPTVVFLVGAGISFAVGSSYTTMGIMMPMVIPLAFGIAGDDPSLALAASGSVLAGACFGDHCSPISDTTVLSSIGSGCDHLEHVRTQLPYAIAIGVISVVFGTLPAGFGVNPWLCIVAGLVASAGLLRLFGKPAEATLPREPPDQPERRADA